MTASRATIRRTRGPRFVQSDNKSSRKERPREGQIQNQTYTLYKNLTCHPLYFLSPADFDNLAKQCSPNYIFLNYIFDKWAYNTWQKHLNKNPFYLSCLNYHMGYKKR